MVITRLAGGLGNQFFQYAAGRALAHRHGVDLQLDTTFYSGRQGGDRVKSFRRDYLLSGFAIKAKEAPASRDPLNRLLAITGRVGLARAYNALRPRILPFLYREPHFHYDPAIEQMPANTYLHGYWQTERYFLQIADLVREEIQPKDPAIAVEARKRVQSLRNEGPVVSLHVRRGDLLVPGNTTARAPFRPEYIANARAMFGQNATFLVFSDDIAWCRANIVGDNVAYAEGADEIEDFVTMTHCDHNVITSSTFSWWAAWLNPNPEKIVVAPNEWFGAMFPNHDTRDLLPASWRRA